MRSNRRLGDIDGDAGGAGKNEVVKFGTKHIQQSTMAGGGNGRQWGVSRMGGNDN
jgi:hypothetical protein